MRLNSRTGTEGSLSIQCDRSLHSGTGAPECNECRLLTLIGVKPRAAHRGTTGTSTMTFDGIGGQALVRLVTLWAWHKLGIYALRKEAANARQYKIWQQGPS